LLQESSDPATEDEMREAATARVAKVNFIANVVVAKVPGGKGCLLVVSKPSFVDWRMAAHLMKELA